MHIDPFILAAQIINFLILAYLLKRFLYDKIVQAMNVREAGIARRLSEADRLKAEARQALADSEKRKYAIDAQAADMLDQARLAADQEKNQLMKEVLRATGLKTKREAVEFKLRHRRRDHSGLEPFFHAFFGGHGNATDDTHHILATHQAGIETKFCETEAFV